jgi:hypothetical protein
MNQDINNEIIAFFESIEKYYGSKTEINESLYVHHDNSNANHATWNLLEFKIIRSAYRKNGDRLMLEGKKVYYEIAAEKLISFKKTGRNSFEFIEKYGESVFRITRIRFKYNY